MSEPLRLALVGATGLIGRAVIDACIGRSDVRLVAIARREMKLPRGARMELFVAEPDKWGEVFEALQPTALISALGTTWKKSGEDEEAFRAVDQQLVLATARAAHAAGIQRLVSISSVGADPRSKNLYLRVKGEVEGELSKVGLKRLDLLRPGLLKGARENDRRLGERLAIIASPLVDPFLNGKLRKYRSIEASEVAMGAIGLATRRAGGRFTHDNDSIRRAAREWAKQGG
ncbi:NAD(P)H-binding protein [Altererythrobacter sp. Z27]|uniref:NAD(P)H-binding protein n=1 Tax=Altererythrobacter sp. Z27 TaxID=3461147 RepID=UPI004044463B